jgi:dihydroorotate dehydrogenase electron transfer subunit
MDFRVMPRSVCVRVATVAQVRRPCDEHVWIDLTVPAFPESNPGQFVQLLCHDTTDAFPSSDIYGEPFLRRPFSIADRSGSSILIISRAIGTGTRYLDRVRPGDPLNVLGPVGTGFSFPQPKRPVLLVGGGVGIPPLLYAARALADTHHGDVVAIFGATQRRLLPLMLRAEPTTEPTACVELPGAARFPALVCSDDGSIGVRGRVTDAIAALHSAAHFAQPPLVMACGPDGMLHAVAELTRRLGWDCQLCIEKKMACGLGTCLSCVTRVTDAAAVGGSRWALACTEGPVFERDRLTEYATRA